MEPWPDQDLSRRRARAQARGEVRDRAERAVVVAPLEADAAERGVAGLDPDPECELGAAAAPARHELLEPLAQRDREAHGLELVLLDLHRVVEEHHHPVAGKMLERAAVLRDEHADGSVVLAQHLDQVLRRSRLRERGEVAQVGEEARDVGAVPGEDLLAVGRRDQRGDLWRDEAGELRPLPLHRFEQTRVRDRDGGLVGERLDEVDLVLAEGARCVSPQRERPDELALGDDRDAQERAVAHELLRAVRVLVVGEDVGDLLGLPRKRHTADDRRSIAPVRVLQAVLERSPLLPFICPACPPRCRSGRPRRGRSARVPHGRACLPT